MPDAPRQRKRRLPTTRKGITHHFSVGGTDAYITVNVDNQGKPVEVFLTCAKQGSVVSGLLNGVAILTSVALRFDVPLREISRNLKGIAFEPSGVATGDEGIKFAASLLDYIFRWLEDTFPETEKS